jgi:hypothetical protein
VLATEPLRLTADWRRLALYAFVAIAIVANLAIIARIWQLMAAGQNQADWTMFTEAGHRAWTGGALYDWNPYYEFRYSPLLAYAFGTIAPIGIVGWRLLSLASLLLLPRKIALMALLAIPLWLDLYAGNVTTILFVLAVGALTGKRWAIGGFMVAALLMPKPLLLPVLVWLLWKHPAWRWRFVAIALVIGAATLLTGYAPDWTTSFIHGRSDFAGPFELGPGRFIGIVWVPIGLALAAWFTWRGRLGFASLAASPYWLPYYLLFLLLEARPDSPFPATPVSRS